MDSNREDAYRFILAAAMLHLKWELIAFTGEPNWFNPFEWFRRRRAVRKASRRAIAFHDLAIHSTLGFEHFSEQTFWNGIQQLDLSFPGALHIDYRHIFESVLAGQAVHIAAPGGDSSIA